MRRLIIILLICLGLGTATSRAAHTEVTLIPAADTVRPGDTVIVAVDLKMDPAWHTYWKNPGESGIATAIKWDLPPGVTAGDIQWPLPRKLPPAEVTTYGYVDEVMLLVPLKLAPDLKPGQSLNLSADVSWLECKEQCLPGKDTVSATLQVGGETKPSATAGDIAIWQKLVPIPLTNSPWNVQAYWEKPGEGDSRSLIIDAKYSGPGAATQKVNSVEVFPAPNDNFEILPAVELLPGQTAGFRLRKVVKKFGGDWLQTIAGVLAIDAAPGSVNCDFLLAVGDKSAASTATSTTTVVPPGTKIVALEAAPTQSLPLMLLYAFIGGLILNIMPCVLPVIALKILGFVGEALSQPKRVRLLGLVYALGVLASFMALAAIVIGIKTAGHLAGWGMQFGNPVFLVCLTTLVMLVALNLFGVFEVSLAGRTLDSASELTTKHGYPGAFFNGLLATALATPCTAPFLSPALGFAFAQSAPVVLLIFFMVGVGLSTPYVALSWNPAWLKYLPKPGAWMERFKIAMGFPMLLTMVWLLNLAIGNYGGKVLWLGAFLVVVALAAWIYGEFVQRGRKHQTIATMITVVLLISGYVYALEAQLHWREPMIAAETTGSLKESTEGIDWQKWTPEAVTAARQAGHPVIVDFTADWCLTCQVNKKTSLEIPRVRTRLKDINAVALLADYTHAPDNITVELNRHGRAGVPMVLVFPKSPDAAPIILPEVLTPGIVLDALTKASG